jgi:hypothetical protein
MFVSRLSTIRRMAGNWFVHCLVYTLDVMNKHYVSPHKLAARFNIRSCVVTSSHGMFKSFRNPLASLIDNKLNK